MREWEEDKGKETREKETGRRRKKGKQQIKE